MIHDRCGSPDTSSCASRIGTIEHPVTDQPFIAAIEAEDVDTAAEDVSSEDFPTDPIVGRTALTKALHGILGPVGGVEWRILASGPSIASWSTNGSTISRSATAGWNDRSPGSSHSDLRITLIG